MKQLLNSLVLISIFSLVNTNLYAQCGNPTSLDGTSNSNYGDWAQSFLADCSGTEFTAIEIYRLGSSANGEINNTLNIYSGQSTAAGNLIHTQAATIPAVAADGQAHLINVPVSGVSYTQGQTYTFQFVGSSSWHFKSKFGNHYTEGAMTNFGNFDASLDVLFQVFSNGGSGGGGGNESCTETAGPFSGGISIANAAIPGAGQTFTAACTGEVTSFTFHLNGSPHPNGFVDIKDSCNGTVFASQGFDASTPGDITVNFDNPYTVTGGQQYMFLVRLDASNSNGLAVRTNTAGGDPYPGGNFSCGGSSDWDLEFSYTIGNGSSAVPTMGEWALIIFALIIMSMGVVTVMRFQKERNRQLAAAKA